MPSKSNPGNIQVRGGKATTNSVGREALDFDILHLLQDLGGGSAPGGSSGQIQYNDAGAFAGSALEFDSLSGALTVPVGVTSNVTSVTATPYTIDPAAPQDFAVMVDTAIIAAGSTINLPAIVAGRVVIIKDASGTATTNQITIVPNGVETIEGDPNLQITADWGGVVLQGTKVAGAPSLFLWQILAMR